MSFMVTQLIGFGGRRGGGGPPAITSITSATSTAAAATSRTFSAVSLGAAATGKRIIVGYTSYAPNPGDQLSSATIDGNAATIAVQLRGGTSTNVLAGLIIANVGDSTTSGDIVLNWSASMQYHSISVWRVTNLTTTIAHATMSDDGATLSGTLNVPANGICVGLAETIDGAPTPSTTWVGLTSDGTTTVGGNSGVAWASGSFGSAQTPLTVGATPPGGRSVIVAASYGN